MIPPYSPKAVSIISIMKDSMSSSSSKVRRQLSLFMIAFCKKKLCKTTRKTHFAKRSFAKRTIQQMSRCYSCLCWAPDAGQRLLWLPLNQYCPAQLACAFAAQDSQTARLIRALNLVFRNKPGNRTLYPQHRKIIGKIKHKSNSH